MPTEPPSLQLANRLDQEDPLRDFRQQFLIPESDGKPDVYFVGNSLGLQPANAAGYLQRELQRWATLGVRGHFDGDLSWMDYQEAIIPTMADLVGARSNEVVIMNTLTVNLHLMMATFFEPNGARNKILIEEHAFPSDQHAVESHMRLRGQDPQDSLLTVSPEPGHRLISTDQVCDSIREHRDSLALILLPGIQYYTGQAFDVATITRAAHRFDIPIGFDMAHAAGNIPMQLHNWDVDFSCWCTYKYLNSGPGSLGGCFIHERHATKTDLPRLAGWWGNDRATLFEMRPEFQAISSAQGWQLSNPPILSLAVIRASLDIFRQAGGIVPLRAKSLKLSRFFRDLLNEKLGDRVRVITPNELDFAGCQLSLEINDSSIAGRCVHDRLERCAVRTDWRAPNVIRAAPTPLYNTFKDVWDFVTTLAKCLD